MGRSSTLETIDGVLTSWCNGCQRRKNIEEFSKNYRTLSGRNSWCKLCSENSRLKNRYNITTEQYEDLVIKQQNKCVICDKIPSGKRHEGKLHIDHCHKSGKIRGLICGNCNKAIGLLNNSPELLIKIYIYLTGGS